MIDKMECLIVQLQYAVAREIWAWNFIVARMCNFVPRLENGLKHYLVGHVILHNALTISNVKLVKILFEFMTNTECKKYLWHIYVEHASKPTKWLYQDHVRLKNCTYV